ncbi:MAG: Bor family protein [Bacteroidaceae bacterium]|nr:Bor family protein [Bacteroidaceae bacterium]
MKKSLLFISGVCLLMTSCMCNKVVVGNINESEELVHVKSVHNIHALGLVVSHDKANNYMEGIPDYVIETKETFGDMLFCFFTCGIFTPNTTKYYVPKSNPNVVVDKKIQFSKAYKGHLK